MTRRVQPMEPRTHGLFRWALRIGVVAAGAVAFLGLAGRADHARAGEAVRSCNVFLCDAELYFRAYDGEVNRIQTAITNNEGRRYWIWDRRNPIQLGDAGGGFQVNGCEHHGPGDNEFPFPHEARRIDVVACRWGNDGVVGFGLDDLNDVAEYVSGPGSLAGGPGDDELRGSNLFILGNDGDDHLRGSDGRERFTGGPGNDVMDGLFGPDDFYGGPGVDTVEYREPLFQRGRVAVSIGDGQANDGQPTNAAGDGDGNEDGTRLDLVSGDVENVVGSQYNDILTGSSGTNRLVGRAGDDRLRGMGGDDELLGGGTEDTPDGPIGFGGNNFLFGGPGNDFLMGGFGPDVLFGEEGDDHLLGDDPLTSDGTDTLLGGPGSDLLDGGHRPFRRDGAPSADQIAGGGGVDRATYRARTARVLLTLDGDDNDGQAGEHDRLLDVEELFGGSGDDVLEGDEAENLLDGGIGEDVLDGGSGGDDLKGGPGFDEVLYRSRGKPVFVSINNVFDDGEQFSDPGGDISEGDNVRSDVEQVTGGLGGDTLEGDNGSTTFFGGPGADRITGGDGPDSLNGQGGDDTLYADDGAADKVLGGAGTDSADVDKDDSTDSIEIFL